MIEERIQRFLPACLRYKSAGFTLVEIMVAMMMAAIGLLALGKFSLAIMDSESASIERLTAVHLAEQVIEEWQNQSKDYPPTIATVKGDCKVTQGVSALLPGSPTTSTCTSISGVVFTITITVASVQAPLPDGAGGIAFADLASTATYTNTPLVKLVTVTWDHKNKCKNKPLLPCKLKSIYLTHLTR